MSLRPAGGSLWPREEGANSSNTVPTGGSTGQVLTKNSGTNYDTGWTTPGGGGGGGGGALVFLSEQIAAAAASVPFTSLISATYDDYDLIWEGLLPGTNNVGMGIQLSTDNGATWITTGYQYGGNNLGVTTNFSNYLNNASLGYASFLAGNIGSAQKSQGTTRLFGLNVSEAKALISQGIICASDGNVYGTVTTARYATSVIVNAIRVIPTSGTLSGRFRLYGIAKV